jgi:hypothetical protein
MGGHRGVMAEMEEAQMSWWDKVKSAVYITIMAIKIKLGGGDSVDIKQLIGVIGPTVLGFLVKFFGDKIGMSPDMQTNLAAALWMIATYFIGGEVKLYRLKKAGMIRP